MAPSSRIREYPLHGRCRADFRFNIISGGCLFIEDDDGARGLSNLVKYWIWCDEHPEDRPVHVIHILETSRPVSIHHIEFIGKKMEEQIPSFYYYIIKIPNWQIPDENWIPKIVNVLQTI